MKQNPFLKYLTFLSFFTIGLVFISISLLFFLPKAYITPMIPYTILGAFAITLASYGQMYWVKKKSPDSFPQALTINKLVKILLFLGLFVSLLFLSENKDGYMPFAIQFVIFYFIFTIVDTIALTKLARKKD